MNATSPILTSLVFSGIPTAFAIAGTIVATIWQPNKPVHSGLLHLAAGVSFSVIGVELLPRITATPHAIGWIVGGFVLGLAIMLATRRLEQQSHQRHDERQKDAPARSDQQDGTLAQAGQRVPEAAAGKRQKRGPWPWGILASNTVDQIIDGILLGVGIVAGHSFGLLLSVTSTVEDLTLAVAIATLLAAARAARWQIIGTTTVLGLLLIAVSVVGTLVAGSLTPQVIAFLLSVASAALLYAVTEQLIIEAHEAATGPVLASMFFVGFLFILILGMMEG